MSFWITEDNEDLTKTSGEHETGGGNIEPIPSNTQVVFAPDEVKYDSYENDRYLSIRWCVLKGEYKGRKVFQKLRIFDADKSKAAKHKKMFAAIAKNAGGSLLRLTSEPTDADLQGILMKPMAGVLQVWELETEDFQTKTGNWVSSVGPINAGSQQAPVQAPPVQQAPQQAPQYPTPHNNQPIDFDEDMPF